MPESIFVQKQNACDIIDDVTNMVRNNLVDTSLHLEYQQVIASHICWVARGVSDEAIPMEIDIWAKCEGISPKEAACHIAECAANYEQVIRDIRFIRLTGKSTIRKSDDDADFSKISNFFIRQLKELLNMSLHNN